MLTAIVMVLAVGTATPQMYGAGQIQKVQSYLERTDQLLEHAKEALRSANLISPLAEQAFTQALKLQEAAWDNFKSSRYTVALTFGRQARDKVNAILTSLRQHHQTEGETVVLRRLERAAELMDRARAGVLGNSQGNYLALYESAKGTLDRAWEFYRNGQYRPALKLAEQVVRTAEKFMNMHSANVRDQQQLERRLESVNQLVGRAEESTADCTSEAAHHYLKLATDALAMGLSLDQQDRPKAALQALKNAQEMAQRSISECQGTGQVTTRYERLLERASRLGELASGVTGPTLESATRLIEQAYKQLGIAKEYLDKGLKDSALPSLQAAELALRQAQRYIEGH